MIKEALPKPIRHQLARLKEKFGRKFRKSFAQCGEDLMINKIFQDKKDGFYVDIGANNPFVQSNTQFFYQLGWHGINIDALPGGMKIFKKVRPRDINLEVPVSDTEEILTYYLFSSSFYNSFSEEQAKVYSDKLIGKRDVKTVTLSKIFDEYLGTNTIDLMSVDVEGWDYNVLQSNNWKKYRPKVVVTEMLEIPMHEIAETVIGCYLKQQGYIGCCCTPANAIFLEKEFYNTQFKTKKSVDKGNSSYLLANDRSL